MVKKVVPLILMIMLCAVPMFPTQADDFVFSRNGITWESSWKQVQAAEAHEEYVDVFTQYPYPGFKNLAVHTPIVAGFEATTLNYLFYNEHFLAIFYEFGHYFRKPDEDYFSSDRDANFTTLVTALNSKYGTQIPDEQDWVTQHLKEFPESLLDYFRLHIGNHVSWQVASNTIATLLTYNDRGHAALAYLNLDKINSLGIGILPGISTEGL